MFETRTDLVTRRGLDGMAARHRAYTDNIANVETPGYSAKEVPFEEQLRTARDAMLLNPENQESLAQAPYDLQSVATPQTNARPDGNTVAIDHQVVLLEQNRLAYEALLQTVRLRHEILHSAIIETPR